MSLMFEWADRDAPEAISQRLANFGRDAAARHARRAVASAIASGLTRSGDEMWVFGRLLGPDRAAGGSPFGNGSDQAVAVAMTARTAGELGRGTVALLSIGDRCAAAAMLRRLLKTEYLLALFACDSDGAAQVARVLGVVSRTVYGLINAGKLPGYRIGRVIRVRRDDLDRYLTVSPRRGSGRGMGYPTAEGRAWPFPFEDEHDILWVFDGFKRSVGGASRAISSWRAAS